MVRALSSAAVAERDVGSSTICSSSNVQSAPTTNTAQLASIDVYTRMHLTDLLSQLSAASCNVSVLITIIIKAFL